MAFPSSVKISLVKLPPEAQIYAEADYNTKKKSLIMAYVLCLTVGAHYFYLRQKARQMIFYATMGGMGVWWIIDIFLLLWYVDKANEEIAREVVAQHRILYP